jgi:hypothetical protein
LKQVRALALATSVLVAACGTIQHYQTPAQPLGKLLAVGIGDVVLRINKSKDLTNIAGKADLWGRRSDLGYTEVRYLGAEQR